jgi:limonene-1,2-epoxide hydrolase
VLTERIDYMLDASGATTMQVRCMGAFEVNDAGKIARWTDYFDTAAFRPKT